MAKVSSRKPLKLWRGINHVTDPTHGDNGKGKIVDVMAKRADMVIRTNGGANAGHTVENKNGVFKFHLIPSGIFYPQAINVIADTVVVDPAILSSEIIVLRKAGIQVSKKNLLIGKNAHLVMPWHKLRDGLREVSRGKGKVGTTKQGIGPTYSDRTERTGLRVGDLLASDLKEKFDDELIMQIRIIKALDPENDSILDRKTIWEQMQKNREILVPLITDVMLIISEYHRLGKNILGEAGQGGLLDLDRGTYPYVTSSHPGVAGFCLATGIRPQEVNRVIGVVKAYATRVGEGPMLTELFDETGNTLREKGKEYGTTTGRPRRCGWLDIPALNYGIDVSGVTSLGITKLDILDTFAEIKLCIGYKLNNAKRFNRWPSADNEFLMQAKPIFETLKGWQKDTTKIRNYKDLPINAKKYLERIQQLIKVPVELISVGPHRDATIYR